MGEGTRKGQGAGWRPWHLPVSGGRLAGWLTAVRACSRRYWHPIVVVGGVLQTALYCDFFYYYVRAPRPPTAVMVSAFSLQPSLLV